MTDPCRRCGDRPSAAGKLAHHCSECIRDLATEAVFTFEYTTERGIHHRTQVFPAAEPGERYAVEVSERESESEPWRPVGRQLITSFGVNAEAGPHELSVGTLAHTIDGP